MTSKTAQLEMQINTLNSLPLCYSLTPTAPTPFCGKQCAKPLLWTKCTSCSYLKLILQQNNNENKKQKQKKNNNHAKNTKKKKLNNGKSFRIFFLFYLCRFTFEWMFMLCWYATFMFSHDKLVLFCFAQYSNKQTHTRPCLSDSC